MKRIYTLVALLFASWGATAQQLSLSDALQKGLERNYSILLEKESIDIAKRSNTWGEAGLYPTLGLSVSQSNGVTNIDNPASFLAGNIINKGVNPVASVNWTLFGGYRVRISKARLEALEQESQGNADIVVQNTLQAIIQGYYMAVLEKERLVVLQKTLKLSRDRYEYVALKKELGASVTADLLLAEGNYLTDSTDYINQELAYRRAIRTLNVLLNEENLDADYALSDSLAFTDRMYDYTALSEEMAKNNANLRRQYLSQSVLKRNTELAKANLYPTIDLRLSYSNNVNSQDLSQAVFANGNRGTEVPIAANTVNYGANFVLTFNLFNGGRIKRAIQNSVVQERIGEMQIAQLKQSLDRDLLSALDLYNVRRQLRAIARRNKEASELNLQIGEESFKNGTITSFDYRILQNNYLNAALSELQATYNLIDAHTQLLRLTGGIVAQ